MTQKTEVRPWLDDHKPFTDKYFMRMRQILENEGINPIVRYQEFARGEGIVKGLDKSIDFILGKAPNAKIYALRDGMTYESGEPLMKLEAPVQEVAELETVYLGLPADGLSENPVDLNVVRLNARAIVQAAGGVRGKPVYEFSARHFHPRDGPRIARVCFEEGFKECSTDIGAATDNKKGIGTISHASILAIAADMRENPEKYNSDNPTVEAALAFNRNIDPAVPRIILPDTFNREIDDAVAVAKALGSKLDGVRIDTCGENYAQGAQDVIDLPEMNIPEKYLRGRGVSVAAVWALRRGLDEAGFGDKKLTVSSGFNAEKTRAFMIADAIFQEMYGKSFFDSIGTGSTFPGGVMTTSDIVAYFSKKKNKWIPHSKVGRGERESSRLEEIK